MKRLSVAAILAAALTATTGAQSISDRAVFGVLRRADQILAEMRIVHRVTVTPALDLAIAIGTTRDWELGPPAESVWWNASRKLGLFLQDRADPAKVFTLAIEPGPPECAARILRATASDTVIECNAEKGPRHPNRKFVYDVRAKSLVRSFEYRPFSMSRVLGGDGRAAVIVGAGTWNGEDGQRVAIEFVPDRIPEFRILGGVEARRWTRHHRSPLSHAIDTGRFGPRGDFVVAPAPNAELRVESVILEGEGAAQRAHQFPPTNDKMFAAMRPQRVQNGYDSTSIRAEFIGPWQVDGDRLWFGKTFYDSEGRTGVGGFGYFDSQVRRFRIFTAPETAAWSVSAILVESDAVWLALTHRGEYGDSNGGLVRFDRRDETYRRFDSSDTGRSFARVGTDLVVATDNGITVVSGQEARHYIVDRTSDGRLRVALLNR